MNDSSILYQRLNNSASSDADATASSPWPPAVTNRDSVPYHQKVKNWYTTITTKFHKPRLWLCLLTYMTQGFKGSLSLAITTLYQIALGGSERESVGLLLFVKSIWYIKVVFALFVDNLPLRGYRLKGYLVIAGGLGLIGYILLAFTKVLVDVGLFKAAFVIVNLSQSLLDVMTDALAIKTARKEPDYGFVTFQSICFSGLALGGLLGYILEPMFGYYPESLFALLALSQIANLFIFHQIREDRNVFSFKTIGRRFTVLKQTLTRPIVLRIWVGVTLLSSALVPSFEIIENDFYDEVLGSSDSTIQLLHIFKSVGQLVGVGIFVTFFSGLQNYRYVLSRGQLYIAFTLFGNLTLFVLGTHNPDISKFILVSSNFLQQLVFSVYRLMPVLILYSKICPQGIEAFLFSFLVLFDTLTNDYLATLSGGYITQWLGLNREDFTGIWILVVIQWAGYILSSIFLHFIIPEEDPWPKENMYSTFLEHIDDTIHDPFFATKKHDHSKSKRRTCTIL